MDMTIWDALKQPPPEALKTITGGRLAGKTDINPQWRYKAMTEQFGVCGIGWKYTVEKLWLEPAGEQICAFAEVGLSIMVDGKWSDPIPGVGGSMILAKESSGLHVSDECYKMAITDALSVAMKMIGVAADVYMGLSDDSKYAEGKKPSQKSQESKQAPDTKVPSLKNLGELYTRAGKYGISPGDVCEAAGVDKGEEIIDLDEAWKATAKKFAGTITAAQEANK